MEGLVISIKEYISPELVYMIPILIVIGSGLKKSTRVSDTLIPLILSCLGIPIALVVSLASKYEPMSAYQIVVWLLMGIGQGIFLGAASVGVHQFFKQHGEYKNLKTWETKEKLREEILQEEDLKGD